MLLNPSIFIQLLVSATCTGMVCLASIFAVQGIRAWDIQSGSEIQLAMERRTYLISTLLSFCFAAQVAVFAFFILTCESISIQFVGAMCATGVLNANPYGWPVLILKILIFFGSAAWLMINHMDNKGYDYPLIKIKYGLLPALLPLMFFETLYLYLFFSKLTPDLIVSCCGSLFSSTGKGVAAEISGMDPGMAVTALGVSGLAVIGAGIACEYNRRFVLLFSLFSVLAFIVALVAIVSFIGLYVYEHPHHHCPFCMLKSGYSFIGYVLYFPLFSGTAAATGAMVMNLCNNFISLRPFVRPMVKKNIRFAVFMFSFFYIWVIIIVVRSNLTMRIW